MILALLLACQTGADSADPAADLAAAPKAAIEPPHYPSAETCAECHPRQYAEWQQSMHRYGARSPVFEAMYLKAFRDSAGEVGSFCTNCHSAENQADGDPGSQTVAERDSVEMEGITCTFCHTAIGHSGPTGDMNIAHNDGSVFVGPYADPQAGDKHKAAQGAFIQQADFCGSCHDVFKFPGLQIEEAYTEYLAGPAPGLGQRCQDCHMSPDPGLPTARPMGPSAIVDGVAYPDREQVSHLWIGPDYTLLKDFPYADDLERSAQARADYLVQSEALLRRGAGLQGAEVTVSGDTVNLTVVVENLTTGHNVPTGFTSERQLWVAVTATDAAGDVVFQSGDEDIYGDIRDTHSWEVQDGTVDLDDQLVNFQSTNVMLQRGYAQNGQYHDDDDDGSIHYAEFPFQAQFVQRHSLEPQEARPIPYVFDCPDQPCHIEVSLHYRNLPPYALRDLQLDEYVERLHETLVDSLSLETE